MDAYSSREVGCLHFRSLYLITAFCCCFFFFHAMGLLKGDYTTLNHMALYIFNHLFAQKQIKQIQYSAGYQFQNSGLVHEI